MLAGFSYLLFNAVSLGCILFLADLWLPQTIDRSLWPPLSWPLAAAIDLCLIALFGLQRADDHERGVRNARPDQRRQRGDGESV